MEAVASIEKNFKSFKDRRAPWSSPAVLSFPTPPGRQKPSQKTKELAHQTVTPEEELVLVVQAEGCDFFRDSPSGLTGLEFR